MVPINKSHLRSTSELMYLLAHVTEVRIWRGLGAL